MATFAFQLKPVCSSLGEVAGVVELLFGVDNGDIEGVRVNT